MVSTEQGNTAEKNRIQKRELVDTLKVGQHLTLRLCLLDGGHETKKEDVPAFGQTCGNPTCDVNGKFSRLLIV